MPRPLRYALPCVLALFAISLLAAGCGANIDEEKDVKEGEAVKLGELRWNVQLTRFLNPTDAEDRGYLAGQRPAPEGKKYLGVFVRVDNESDAAAPLPKDFVVTDTRGVKYAPIASRSPYALPLAGQLGPDDELPAPDTTAANGPIQGAMILFLISEESTQNRPLELDIPGSGGRPGKVELDI